MHFILRSDISNAEPICAFVFFPKVFTSTWPARYPTRDVLLCLLIRFDFIYTYYEYSNTDLKFFGENNYCNILCLFSVVAGQNIILSICTVRAKHTFVGLDCLMRSFSTSLCCGYFHSTDALIFWYSDRRYVFLND
jgi:hypothetical protein